jgi:periplasmic protein TonB
MLKKCLYIFLVLFANTFPAQEVESGIDFEAIPVGGKEQTEQVLQTQLYLPKPLLTPSFHADITAYFDLDSAGNATNIQIDAGVNNLLRNEVKRVLRLLKFNRTHKQTDLQPYFMVFNLSTEKYNRYFKQKYKHKVKGDPDSSFVIYTRADVAPEYYKNGDEGLAEFILSEIQYPNVAIERSIEGTVIIEFVVETNGYITGITVKKGLNGGCTEEAIALIKKTRWQPAVYNQKLVRYRMSYPITFSLRSVNMSSAQTIE